ncbi:hypothetical protein QQY66_32685 [Streptomyces sp. DG2A-72]|uniref:hypothetical protein n=1 Tax=Streptomyces sp. DG2A-72 TaxID=3051386 RepID=UPI00265C4F51|nr:hypothetical protein [Streptomyces sp. DG2A-72]MDO0936230.1 hypothetical protein [Streptomyces sp. DG2A-72]
MPLAAGYLKAVIDADPDPAPETDVRIHNVRGRWSITQMARMIFGDGDTPDVLAFSVLGWNYRNFACLAELFKQLNGSSASARPSTSSSTARAN